MQLKNIDKNLIGNIVIIVSIILLILFIVMFYSAFYEAGTVDEQTVEWNGMEFDIPYDSEYELTNDSLKFTSEYKIHNIEFTKTNDTAEVNKNLVDLLSWATLDVNSTHVLIECDSNYGIIIPKDGYQTHDMSIIIDDNVEVIEVHGDMRLATDRLYR